MVEMAKRLGRREEWLYDDPLDALKRAFENALEGGAPIDLLKGMNLRVKERSNQEYQTPSKKIEFYSSIAKDGITPLPKQ